jgi:hypothetical protein
MDINKINIKLIFLENNHDENTPLTRTLHYYGPNAIWTD